MVVEEIVLEGITTPGLKIRIPAILGLGVLISIATAVASKVSMLHLLGTYGLEISFMAYVRVISLIISYALESLKVLLSSQVVAMLF